MTDTPAAAAPQPAPTDATNLEARIYALRHRDELLTESRRQLQAEQKQVRQDWGAILCAQRDRLPEPGAFEQWLEQQQISLSRARQLMAPFEPATAPKPAPRPSRRYKFRANGLFVSLDPRELTIVREVLAFLTHRHQREFDLAGHLCRSLTHLTPYRVQHTIAALAKLPIENFLLPLPGATSPPRAPAVA